MKEIRFFYVPNASTSVELPDDEATHALRVLRMESGDEMMLTDGNGYFYKAFLKIDYQAILSLYLLNNEGFYKIIIFFLTFLINIITGVNINDLQSCLRIYGVI
jgi:hypothetical protein